MFQGASELAIDAKGRMAIPTRHRELLTAGGGLVITAHPDGCLLIYSRDAWLPIGLKLQSLPSFNEQARWWQRLLVGHAEELELDAAGRVLVSSTLREFAGIGRNVTLVGQLSHFELWDSAAWKEKILAARQMASTTPPPGAESFTL
jgi:MraZ protein